MVIKFTLIGVLLFVQLFTWNHGSWFTSDEEKDTKIVPSVETVATKNYHKRATATCAVPSNLDPNAIIRNLDGELIQDLQEIPDETAFQFKCNDGYAFSGSKCAKCSNNAIGPIDQQCIRICPVIHSQLIHSFLKYTNGTVVMYNLMEGEEVDVTCEDGYLIDASGLKEVRKTCNGGTLGTLPVCLRVCAVPTIANSITPQPSDVVLAGSTVTVSCQTTHAYSSNDTVLTCQSSGFFSEPFGRCRAICNDNITADHLTVEQINTEGNLVSTYPYLLEGMAVRLACGSGYQLFGDNRADCLKNGSLAPTGQYCIQTCSYNSSDLVYSKLTDSSGNPLFRNILENDTLIVTCNPGFQFEDQSTVVELRCENGTLDIIPPCYGTCHVIRHPFVTYDNPNDTIMEGSSVTVSCEPTYQYSLGDSLVHTCARPRVLEPAIGSCRKQCIVPNLANGHFVMAASPTTTVAGGSTLLENDMMAVVCNENYRPVADADETILTRCKDDGTFENYQRCFWECPVINDPHGEYSNVTTMKPLQKRPLVGQSVQLECLTGFVACDVDLDACDPATESIILTCNDGDYIGSHECKQTCPPPTISNGIFTFNYNSLPSVLVEGNEIEPECNSGYHRHGPFSLTCRNGEWGKCLPDCRKGNQALIFARNSEESTVIKFDPNSNPMLTDTGVSLNPGTGKFLYGGRGSKYFFHLEENWFTLHLFNLETLEYESTEITLGSSISEADVMMTTCDHIMFCGGHGSCSTCRMFSLTATASLDDYDYEYPMESCRYHGCATCEARGMCLMFGGEDSDGNALATVSTGFDFFSDMPSPLAFCHAVSYEEYFYVCGIRLFDPCFKFSAIHDVWEELPQFTHPRANFQLVALHDVGLYAMFGKDADGDCEPSIEVLSFDSQTSLYRWDVINHGSDMCFEDFTAVENGDM